MKIFTDPRVAMYGAPDHPEASWRVTRSAEHLRKAGWPLSSPTILATERDVRTVHSEVHWDAVKGGDYHDADTPFFSGIHEIALLSLSGALSAMESAVADEPAFSLMRPPGHHAGPERVSGFCYLNNMAIACVQALKRGLRVAVLDIDVHHGDGTEEIAKGRAGWFFVSLHQSPLYPGTGLVSEQNCRNYPLPAGTDEKMYLPILDRALEEVVVFKPDVLGVSAGFDTFERCPIAQFRLEVDTYEKIGRRIAATGLPRFALLEGGYAEELPVLIEKFLTGFKLSEGKETKS